MIIIVLAVVFALVLVCVMGLVFSLKNKSKLTQDNLMFTQMADQMADQMTDQIVSQSRNIINDQSQKQTIEIIKQMQEQKDQLFNLLQQLQAQQQKTSVDNFQKAREEQMKFFKDNMTTHVQYLNTSMQKLTDMTERRLKEMNELVADKLASGFEKTSKVFADIMKRLALIDNAQQKIEALSENVVSLQSLLDNKSARGAFGEVQLNTLLENMLSNAHYELQSVLSNQKRADCLLKLPQPMGNLVIDAKFPLENYQRYIDAKPQSSELQGYLSAFKRDIKKHINDIADKYIIEGETADSAVMFVPSEAVFAKIHADLPDVVQYSHNSRVWITSPTTMMAILTTVKAVIKDGATRKQVHLIQKHLGVLAKDFSRFSKRMDGLKKHISQAKDDVDSVGISTDKIIKHFDKIESVELDDLDELGSLDDIDKIGDLGNLDNLDNIQKIADVED
jgi:DNA recombination protein RmuC